MKFYLKFVLFSLSILATAPTFAMEDHRSAWADLVEYNADMDARGLPRTLIIACGHEDHFYSSQQGEHTHPNCWCVDVKEHGFGWSSGEPTQPHWKNIHANEELDITQSIIPQSYKNNFDTVVVERPGQKTINNLWTIFNAARMAKVGGELTVDCCGYQDLNYRMGIPTGFYEMKMQTPALQALLSGPKELPDNRQPQFNLFTTIDPFAGIGGVASLYYSENGYQEGNARKNKLYFQDIIRAGKHEYCYGENFNPENICKKLELFQIKMSEKDPINFCPSSTPITMNIGNYLANWGFTDIVALGKAYQPYGKIPNTGIVSATKTQGTQDLMPDWSLAIRSVH